MKQVYELSKREVEITDMDFNGDTVLVIDAYYVDKDEQLSDEELSDLQDKYAEELAQEAYEHMVDQAHDRLEALWERV